MNENDMNSGISSGICELEDESSARALPGISWEFLWDLRGTRRCE